MTLYSTGMRRAELCHLETQDIDKARMVVHIRQGKGGKDRDVPLSSTLLAQLRTYWRSLPPQRASWLFPSLQHRHAGEPITSKTVWHACRTASRRAGLTKNIHPHTLRHYAEFRTMPSESRPIRHQLELMAVKGARVVGGLGIVRRTATGF
jgi:site-specific recombinase XerD